MASLADLPLKYRLLMRTYRYRSVDWRPGAVLTKPLSRARIAAITTAAYYSPDQAAFDASIRGGDRSFRIIPLDTDLRKLRIAHRSSAFDHRGIEADQNLALPLDRLQELVQDGLIGSVAPRHFSFMGSISAPGRLVSTSAPAVTAMLGDDGVDGVLLTPV
jgi:D-proline reductase (dithiol) PrdB